MQCFSGIWKQKKLSGFPLGKATRTKKNPAAVQWTRNQKQRDNFEDVQVILNCLSVYHLQLVRKKKGTSLID